MNKPRVTLLACCMLAGVWAVSVTSYTIATINPHSHTAEMVFTADEAAGRRFNRDKTPRTQPYDEKSAPPFIERDGTVRPGVDEVVPEDFAFPDPVGPDTVPDVIITEPSPGVTPPSVVPTPSIPQADVVTGAVTSLRRLFQGEGNFQDILTIAVAAITIYGGLKLGGSDQLLKVILSLFSKKGNFNAILEDRLGGTASRRSRRRARK